MSDVLDSIKTASTRIALLELENATFRSKMEDLIYDVDEWLDEETDNKNIHKTHSPPHKNAID